MPSGSRRGQAEPQGGVTVKGNRQRGRDVLGEAQNLGEGNGDALEKPAAADEVEDRNCGANSQHGTRRQHPALVHPRYGQRR